VFYLHNQHRKKQAGQSTRELEIYLKNLVAVNANPIHTSHHISNDDHENQKTFLERQQKAVILSAITRMLAKSL